MTLPKHRFAASSLAGVTDAHADRKAQGDFSAQPLKQWHWQHLLCSLGTSWQPLEAFFIVRYGGVGVVEASGTGKLL